MLLLKYVTGPKKAFLTKEYVIKRNSTELKAIDVFKCLLAFLFANRNVFSAGGLSSTDIEWEGPYDEPKEIIEDCIQAQRKLLCGFFGNEKANKKKALESNDPKNAAISLAGEPMLYPEIGELISEFHRRDFTTFLVSNGLTPSKLKDTSSRPHPALSIIGCSRKGNPEKPVPAPD